MAINRSRSRSRSRRLGRKGRRCRGFLPEKGEAWVAGCHCLSAPPDMVTPEVNCVVFIRQEKENVRLLEQEPYVWLICLPEEGEEEGAGKF